MKTIVGIDLGTTFSLVSHLQAGKPVLLPNALGEILTPSAVSVADDGTVLVGALARARAAQFPTRTALSFKRDMGTDKSYDLGGKRMSPQQLSALVLGSLKRDAEIALGQAIDEAVVTVPAYFGDAQRQATRDAATLAGLHVERIINEPTAAALAYGLNNRDRETRAVVLDLGGGTFDVTVLEVIEGVIEIQSSSGDARLGGDDFDAALATLVARSIQAEKNVDVAKDPRAWARVRDACEQAKKRLSDLESSRVALAELPLASGGTLSYEREITRVDAETAWEGLLERMRGPILRALHDAKLAPNSVQEVLLVGGSTRMPCVARLAAQVFGRLPLRSLPPDEAVAMGAAIQAALKAQDAAVDDMVLTDVAPFTLGIEASSRLGDGLIAGIFAPILERGTVIPTSRVKRFHTLGDLQTSIEVRVYQGEHSLCSENTRLGEYRVIGLPAAPAGQESIDVRFTYDLNGILEVETEVVSTGTKGTLVIERSPGRMSADEVERARKSMASMKLHPREALPNTVALARADQLFVELSGPERLMLGEGIAGFRAVLDSQDPVQIEKMRGALNQLADRLRR